jgi:hypothetical protein
MLVEYNAFDYLVSGDLTAARQHRIGSHRR